jgi:hypothetical protein
MQRWEYMVVEANLHQDHVVSINQAKPRKASFLEFLSRSGMEGWELTTSTVSSTFTAILIFKRPIPN